MVCEGGEVAFVSRILAESLKRTNDVQWYSAMFRFWSTVMAIIQRLKTEENINWAVCELLQGTKTGKWVVAWSFGAMRAAENARGRVSNKQFSLPPPSKVLAVSVPKSDDLSPLASGLRDVISKLNLSS